ncbi:dihydropteroate synthase [Mesorhizobium sp. NBSH29]|uniref:dihydropteroate synthase n=1 Tax=Mesorhizobium sp. NBSH29 TaxID=2654249 RepID=UPI001896543A|nr:dihydropteroate synthase [Mesorhizobium sp. NBSH29]QPC87950.1 dihydropteroate synthase [Mesorhizobium sp. NBSH29]
MKRWHLAHGRHLEVDEKASVMGILNVTPDSFSDGGQFVKADDAVARALQMMDEGAAIIDVGGESTRPGALPITAVEEQARILPVIRALAVLGRVIISVDTYRAETAALAVAAGAHIVNDISGLGGDAAIARVAAETGAGLCIMHTGRDRQKLADIIEDQFLFLRQSLEIAANAGVAKNQIVLDPGFGFAKDGAENIALMARFSELLPLGHPFMVGTSRKRMIGELTGRDAGGRDAGTAATSHFLRLQGAVLFRVHNVAMNVDALAVADAMLKFSGEAKNAY